MGEEVHPLLEADAARENAEERARLLRRQHEDNLRITMSSFGGRQLIYTLLERDGLWRSSFTGDRQGTDFREGMRNSALMLWADLKQACPDLMLRMQEEQR